MLPTPFYRSSFSACIKGRGRVLFFFLLRLSGQRAKLGPVYAGDEEEEEGLASWREVRARCARLSGARVAGRTARVAGLTRE